MYLRCLTGVVELLLRSIFLVYSGVYFSIWALLKARGGIHAVILNDCMIVGVGQIEAPLPSWGRANVCILSSQNAFAECCIAGTTNVAGTTNTVRTATY